MGPRQTTPSAGIIRIQVNGLFVKGQLRRKRRSGRPRRRPPRNARPRRKPPRRKQLRSGRPRRSPARSGRQRRKLPRRKQLRSGQLKRRLLQARKARNRFSRFLLGLLRERPAILAGRPAYCMRRRKLVRRSACEDAGTDGLSSLAQRASEGHS